MLTPTDTQTVSTFTLNQNYVRDKCLPLQTALTDDGWVTTRRLLGARTAILQRIMS
jgi:hypothetical protein